MLFNKRLLFLFLFNILLAGGIVLSQWYIRSNAAQVNELNTQDLSITSSFVQTNTVSLFSLYKENGSLYTSSQTGPGAVLDFLTKNPVYPAQSGRNRMGISSQTHEQSSVRIFPQTFTTTSSLQRIENDSQEAVFQTPEMMQSGEHYFYTQTVSGLPVYNAVLGVHLRNQSDIYAVDGNVLVNTNIPQSVITQDQAKEAALAQGKIDAGPGRELVIVEIKEYILNKKLLGIDEDETNYHTFAVTVADTNPDGDFAVQYFVDAQNGSIVYKESLIHSGPARQIYNCQNPNPDGTCPLVRSEGQPPTGDAEADGVYDVAGGWHNFVQGRLGRNGYDGKGGGELGFVHLEGVIGPCQNAWGGNGKTRYCSGWVATDIVGHEFTHLLTEKTANLAYNMQSGALNESISDIMGSEMDNNWVVAENIQAGPLRYMDDPTRPGAYNLRSPDRVFSQYYYCGTSWDYGGVHVNSGVVNKTYFLLVDGGSFNGCTINGIGREKAIKVVYKALKDYLRASSNFKDMYMQMNRACNDLYGSASNTCISVKKSLEATEMDQQPDYSQTGALCQHKVEKSATCSYSPSATVRPTRTPTPTQQAGPTVTPTPTPDGNPTATPTPTPNISPTQTPNMSQTPTPTPDGNPTVTPTPGNSHDSTLVARWRMDEKSGATVTDDNGNHGGVAFKTTIVGGKDGRARKFESEKKSMIKIPLWDGARLQSFTIAFWMKGKALQKSRDRWMGNIIPYNGGGAYVSKQFPYFLTTTSISTYTGYTFRAGLNQLTFVVGKKGGVSDSVTTPIENVLDDSWHLVVGTYGNGEMALFIDGNQKSSKNVSGDVRYDPDRALVLGALDGVSNFYFDGNLDDIRIYQGVLSNKDITNLKK